MPGHSCLGEGSAAPTFGEMRADTDIQQRIERSAAQAGRAFFGWRDLLDLYAPRGEARGAFDSHVPQGPTPATGGLKRAREEDE